MTKTIELKTPKRGLYHSTWTMNDTILTFFCEKWGVHNLVSPLNENDALDELANSFIGSTGTSLKQQMLNFRYLLTNGSDGLSATSTIQKSVYDKYNNYTKEDLKNVCFEIMSTIDTENIYKTFNKTLVENEAVSSYNKVQKEKKEMVKDINDMNRKDAIKYAANKLGKSPKKLISLEEYMKLHPNFVPKVK